jgi:iron complex transport system substrate-binding protein
MKIALRLSAAILAVCWLPWFLPSQATAGSPVRVIALAPSLTEIVYALDRGNLLVGASTYSDFPEEAKRLPRVGSYAHPDLERILALLPDCCLAVEGMTPRETTERLISLGVPVHILDTSTLAAVFASIEKIGNLLDASERAVALADAMRQTVARITRKRGDGPQPSVLYQIGYAPMYAACGGTFINELIELAGGKNVCATMRGYPRLTPEQAVAFRPDVVLIPTMGREAFEAARTQWNAWPEVPAVHSGRIFILDSDLFDRPGPRLTQGLEELARLLHIPPVPATEKQP